MTDESRVATLSVICKFRCVLMAPGTRQYILSDAREEVLRVVEECAASLST